MSMTAPTTQMLLRQAIRQSMRRSLVVASDHVLLRGEALFYAALSILVQSSSRLPCLSTDSDFDTVWFWLAAAFL